MYRRIFRAYLINFSRFSIRSRPGCELSSGSSWNCQPSRRFGNDETGNESAASSAASQNKVDVMKAVESLGDKFKDSLDLLEDAKSSLGTVYFSEDMNDAEQSVEETVLGFQRLLDQIDAEQRAPVGSSLEPKIEELKMQLHLLKESAKTLKMKKR